MDQPLAARPLKTAQELTGEVARLIAENARPEAEMSQVRFVANACLPCVTGNCNWRIVLVSPATDEQRRVLDWATGIVQQEWNMLERRRTPRG